MSLNRIINYLKGGPGSGNFGHAGRPGERGGSSSGSGGSSGEVASRKTQALRDTEGARMFIRGAQDQQRRGNLDGVHDNLESAAAQIEHSLREASKIPGTDSGPKLLSRAQRDYQEGQRLLARAGTMTRTSALRDEAGRLLSQAAGKFFSAADLIETDLK